MKKSALLTVLWMTLGWLNGIAQQASGNILVNNRSKTTLENSLSPVHHFGDFKTGRHKIVFNLKTEGFPTTSDGKEVAIIVFETIVKINGKTISQTKGKPLPFFPGEMGMPVEAFDLISPIFLHHFGLEKSLKENPKLSPIIEKGATYEVELRAEVVNGTGKIAPAFLIIII